MYKITQQLKNIGFSLNKLDYIIERNNYKREFATADYFCIYIFLDDIRIIVENVPYDIPGGNTVFVGPHKKIIFEKTESQDFFVVAFSSSFYERSTKDSLFLNSQVFFNYNSNIFVSPLKNIKEMKVIFVESMSNFQAKDEALYISAAHNAIERLILDALLNIPTEEVKNDPKLNYLNYVNRFNVILQRDFRTSKTVLYYSNELNISSRKLTEMTEYVTGKSAKQIIIDKVIAESKKELTYSTSTISQISYDLGFSDEANFSNFIKKHTGKNPSTLKTIK
ncbi:helix-turn-helix domain-containing protein [Chryseobacterium indoltheticum]|uniref:helix-turn-helix domain-containing protein n=1 Tax=Chryseobacterium indoltheticum TaxID=254 RepID=UPI00191470EC|nr:helix-turn-helix domain-containing protein [Chryseobacterium indoltheticum]QQQ29027.1 helix-turn-helix domain-containing protein [Chryseobacterium indoltheticum]